MTNDRIIIGIGGRKESGKTVIGKITKSYGFKVVRFAEPLKQLIADLIFVSRAKLDSLKNVKQQYKFTDRDYEFLSERTNINVEFIKEKMVGRELNTVRDLLQVIGTDVIRTAAPNWHVDKTLEYINSEEMKNENIIIDDLRFPNERRAIEENGGTCWFIVRPKIDNVSNHESETALKWQDFDNVIINDSTLEYLEFNWRVFMDYGYAKSLELKQKLYNKIISNNNYLDELKGSNEKFTLLDAMFISKHEFTYRPYYLTSKDNDVVEVHDSGGQIYAFVTNEDEKCGSVECITNPLIIEDLKRYI